MNSWSFRCQQEFCYWQRGTSELTPHPFLFKILHTFVAHLLLQTRLIFTFFFFFYSIWNPCRKGCTLKYLTWKTYYVDRVYITGIVCLTNWGKFSSAFAWASLFFFQTGHYQEFISACLKSLQKLSCQHQFNWQEFWGMVVLNDKRGTGFETAQVYVCLHDFNLQSHCIKIHNFGERKPRCVF